MLYLFIIFDLLLVFTNNNNNNNSKSLFTTKVVQIK